MKTIEITAPDGKTLQLNAPDDATPEQIHQAATAAAQHYQSTMPKQPEQGMVGKAWDALNVPSQMAQSGLQQMTDLGTDAQNAIAAKTGLPVGTEPTGNMARDVVANIPRIAGETLSEVAPKFIDRTSLATMGAGAALKAAGKATGAVLKAAPGITKPLENIAGLRPGAYPKAFADPGMITDFGAKAGANSMYNVAKEGMDAAKTANAEAAAANGVIPKVAGLEDNAGNAVKTITPKPNTGFGTRSTKLVGDAFKSVNNSQPMEAADAFKARKVVTQMLSSKNPPYPKDDLLKLKDELANQVFSSVKGADQAYARAIQGEMLRSPVPLNNNGTSSKVGAAVMRVMPWFLKPVFSPVMMGSAMSGLGAASQMAPQTIGKTGVAASMIDDAFSRYKKRKGG